MEPRRRLVCKVNYAGNYGWDTLYWGGTKYSGLEGGPKWLPGFDKPIIYYVPSIATSACLIIKARSFQLGMVMH